MPEDATAGLARQEGALVGVIALVAVASMALIYFDIVNALTGAGFLLVASGVVAAVSAQAFEARIERVEASEEEPDRLTAMMASTARSRKWVAVFGIIAGAVLLTLGFLLG